MDQAEASGGAIYIASITVVEVVYLVEKGRLPLIALTTLLQTIKSSTSAVTVVALDYDVAHTMQSVPRHIVPDMPDRIIAATALHLNLPLVTRDHKIQAAQVVTIW
jgi:PIN domain nuclease of toxin-antitoxin system